MDPDAALGKIINGTCVVTAKSGKKGNGMTAAWFTRVSFSPPLVMVSVGHKRFTHGLIRESGSFCINVLAEGQLPLSKHFGFSSGRNADKLEGIPHTSGKTGSPVLEGTAAHLDCRLVSSYEAGDHTLFVGEVVDASASKKRPLLATMEDYK
jgi:flavin reductase (DIM6/NTAB) family NADH-FMN oxidoreductase RutF